MKIAGTTHLGQRQYNDYALAAVDEEGLYAEGALALLLRLCVCAGVAPLRANLAGAGWRFHVSTPLAALQAAFITLLNMVMVLTLILYYDKSQGTQGTFLQLFIRQTDNASIMLIASIAVYRGPAHMESLKRVLTKLDKIKFDLNISGPVASSEKKKSVATVMVLMWMICTALMQYYDNYIFAEKCKEDNVLLLMLVYYNIPRSLADIQGVIVILRWAWTVLAVYDVNTTLNEHMHWLLTGSDFMSLPSQSEKLIRRLVFSHERISEIMKEMNDTNGVMLMVIFMSKFLRIILAPYYMFVEKELFAVPLYLNWLLFHLVVLMLTIEPCHWTHTQREHTMTQLGQMILHLAPKSKGISDELDQFAKQVVLNNVKFETLGVYTLDRHLTSMILGGVTTYVVILIQFQMLSP